MCASTILERATVNDPWIEQAGSVVDDPKCYLAVNFPVPNDPTGIPTAGCDRRACVGVCNPKSTVLLDDGNGNPLRIKLECCCEVA